MAMLRSIAAVGIAKQSGKGAAAAVPAYGFGVMSGNVFQAPITQVYEAMTLPGGASDRFSPAVNRTDVVPGAAFKTRLWPSSSGLWLLAALGTNVDSGPVSGVYTHTITPALDVPYLTLFAKLTTGEFEKLPDCKVQEITFTFTERGSIELDVVVLGLVPSLSTASWAATVDETVNTYYTPNGGTFLVDAGSNVPAAAQVKAASVKIGNNLAGVPLSKSVLPDDLVPGQQIVEGTLGLIPNDFGDWKKVLSTGVAGTVVKEKPVYGSFSLKYQIDANTDLTLAALRVPMLTDFPPADPSGGPVEVDLSFLVARPTDASAAFTATDRNTVATY